MPLSLLALAAAVAAATPCSYPNNLSGVQVWGLSSSAAGAGSSSACENACCTAGASCDTWQFCPGNSPAYPLGCGAAAACWIGLGGGQHALVPDWVSFTSEALPSAFFIDASTAPQAPAPIPGLPAVVGGPNNQVLSITTASLVLDGSPILPFAGEMHFSRLPRDAWAADLMAMKAGGLDIVQAYVFWLHTEEVQGQQDWTGNRDLAAFLDAAATAGLLVALRVGPWCHGEARNGGWPDWVQNSGVKVRTNSSAWLGLVRGWYTGLAAQMRGRYWADGGPIVSIQLDNETPDVAYLLALRALAVEVGMSPFMFIKTGWPAPDAPVDPALLFPVSGGYFDEFWGTDENATGGFLFAAARSSNQSYPVVTAEAGPGMASSYHRRIRIDSAVATAAIQMFLANGAVQVGMYMYHGGSDPIGALSTMQEQQGLGEGGANDMPCMTYDFVAPLGECGQPRAHFHGIRRVATVARANALLLAVASTFVPAVQPGSPSDTATLRWAARGDGTQALVFLDTVQTFASMQPQTGLRLTLRLAGGDVAIPAAALPPLAVPAGAAPVWAAGIGLGEVGLLQYATAAPLGTISDGNGGGLSLWAATAGVRVDIEFAAPGAAWFCTGNATCTEDGDYLLATNVVPGYPGSLQPQITFSIGGVPISLLVLDGVSADRVWVSSDSSVAYISDANTTLVADAAAGGLTLKSTTLGTPAHLTICPAPKAVAMGTDILPPTRDGYCAGYAVPLPPPGVTAVLTPVAAAGPPRVIPKGKRGVAEAPARDGTLGEFNSSAVWTVALKGAPSAAGVDVRLSVDYSGDAARVYRTPGGTHAPADLLMDHFWQGQALEVPLTRAGVPLGPGGPGALLELRVLPQGPRDVGAPVYFEAPPAAGAAVAAVRVVETATVLLAVQW